MRPTSFEELQRRRPAAILILGLLAAASASALPLRLISAVGLDLAALEAAETPRVEAVQVDEALVLRLAPGLSLSAEAIWREAPSRLVGGAVGAAFVLAPGFYVETGYGGSYRGTEGPYTHELRLAANAEGGLGLLGLSLRGKLSEAALSAKASAYGKAYPFPWLRAWGSYSLGWEYGAGLDQSFWGNLELGPEELLFLILGGSVASYRDGAGRPAGLATAAFAGLRWAPLETLALKLQSEYAFRGERAGKTSHLLVADLRL